MASLKIRKGVYYLQYYVGTKQMRTSLGTGSLQIAKEKLRKFESAQLRGEHSPLPTQSAIADVVTAYVRFIRSTKSPKSAQTDIYYMRDAFGPICEALQVTSRKLSPLAKKRPPKPGQDRRRRPHVIEAQSFEQITTSQISTFVLSQVQSRGLAPKTANRYREILTRLFNWAMEQHGVRMPGDKNPAARVERFKERAPEIRFLTLAQVDSQLQALQHATQLQAMVAMYIYAGLRREELLQLTTQDVDLGTGPYGMIRIQAKTVDGNSWQPKTGVNRVVPISSTLRTYLDRYSPQATKGGWYFPSPEGTLWDPDNFSRHLRSANRAAKLVWGCLDYRHTFGSQLAMKGESLYKIAKLMGNSPEICRRHYAALTPEGMTDTVEFPVVSTAVAVSPAAYEVNVKGPV